jgi:hypothetical protein
MKIQYCNVLLNDFMKKLVLIIIDYLQYQKFRLGGQRATGQPAWLLSNT